MKCPPWSPGFSTTYPSPLWNGTTKIKTVSSPSTTKCFTYLWQILLQCTVFHSFHHNQQTGPVVFSLFLYKWSKTIDQAAQATRQVETRSKQDTTTLHCIGGQGSLSLQLIQILPGFPLAPHPQVTLRFHQHRQPAPTAMSLGRCWCCLHTGSQAGAGQALDTGISAVVLWFWLHAEFYDVVM